VAERVRKRWRKRGRGRSSGIREKEGWGLIQNKRTTERKIQKQREHTAY
jgi:hypothetical protein